MDKTKFTEQLSELIETEMDGILKSSVLYKDDEATEIISLTEDETKFKITVSKI